MANVKFDQQELTRLVAQMNTMAPDQLAAEYAQRKAALLQDLQSSKLMQDPERMMQMFKHCTQQVAQAQTQLQGVVARKPQPAAAAKVVVRRAKYRSESDESDFEDDVEPDSDDQVTPDSEHSSSSDDDTHRRGRGRGRQQVKSRQSDIAPPSPTATTDATSDAMVALETEPDPSSVLKIEKILASRRRLVLDDGVEHDPVSTFMVDGSHDVEAVEEMCAPHNPAMPHLNKHLLRLRIKKLTKQRRNVIATDAHPQPVLGHRTRLVEEFLVKIETQSYMHTEWHTAASMERKFGHISRVTQRIKKFCSTESVLIAANNKMYDGAPFDPQYLEVDRVVASMAVRPKPQDGEFDSLVADHQRKLARHAAYCATLDIGSVHPPTPQPPSVEAPRTINMYLVKWRGLGYSQATWESEDDIVAFAAKIAEFKRFNKPPAAVLAAHKKAVAAGIDVVAMPINKKAITYTPAELEQRRSKWYADNSHVYKTKHQLRMHQIDGLNFMIQAWHERRNIILGDEMGLGKTAQVVTFFEHLRRVEGVQGPFLVVVPLATLSHWQREFTSWTDFNVLVYHDTVKGNESRPLIRELEWFYKDTRVIKFNVMIVSTDTLQSDQDEIRRVPWQFVVVDEGHRIKNMHSQLNMSLRHMECSRRMLLTGTPVQNNTDELWTLLHYIEPEVFPNLDAFKKQFGSLTEGSQVMTLQEVIRPYFLRRMKETVARSLPAKTELMISVCLTTMQRKYYEALYRRSGMQDFNGTGNSAAARKKRREIVVAQDHGRLGGADGVVMSPSSNLHMELRQCCDSAFMIGGVEEQELPFDRLTSDVYITKMLEASGKMLLLHKLLPKLKAEGHRVLIFSQFIRVLDMVQEFAEYHGWALERLDGSSGSRKHGGGREASIDRFNDPDSDRFLFLLSTRAGGVGITLTAADTVIMFDSDWNPQEDAQAIARAHRIGQTRPVTIYRLITEKSYESAMFRRSSAKLGLDHALLTNLEAGKNGAADATSRESIEALLREGAYILTEELSTTQAKEAAAKTESIEDILAKRTLVIAETQARHDADGGEPTSMADVVKSRLSYTNMRFDPDSELALLPSSWAKMVPPSERYTCAELLSQLTDRSAVETGSSCAEFWSCFSGKLNKALSNQLQGENAEDLVGLIEQFVATHEFSKQQRDEAMAWSLDVERIAREVEEAAKEAARAQEATTRAEEAAARTTARNQKRRTAAVKADVTRRRKRAESSDEEDVHEDENEDEDEIKEEKKQQSEGGDDEEDTTTTTATAAPKAAPSNKPRRKGALNAELCVVCHKSGKLLVCEGKCQQWYHLECAGLESPPDTDNKWECDCCANNTHACFICHQQDKLVVEQPPDIKPEDDVEMKEGAAGEDEIPSLVPLVKHEDKTESVSKCSIATCGRYYHVSCLKPEDYPTAVINSNTQRFRCPLHGCVDCGMSGDSQSMVQCVTCPAAVHIRCIKDDEVRLGRKSMLCALCVVRVGPTPMGQAAIADSQTNSWEVPYRPKKKRAGAGTSNKRQKTDTDTGVATSHDGEETEDDDDAAAAAQAPASPAVKPKRKMTKKAAASAGASPATKSRKRLAHPQDEDASEKEVTASPSKKPRVKAEQDTTVKQEKEQHEDSDTVSE